MHACMLCTFNYVFHNYQSDGLSLTGNLIPGRDGTGAQWLEKNVGIVAVVVAVQASCGVRAEPASEANRSHRADFFGPLLGGNQE